MRFEPDTWVDALLRPLAMAAPDANVYVEIMAPDMRFAFVLALALALVAAALLRIQGKADGAAMTSAHHRSSRPVLILLAVTAVGFVSWLATSGNGRYFIAGLLIVGPVCIGLTRLLPITRAMRFALAMGMLAVQTFAVCQTAPWHGWGMVSWKEAPYFHVEVPAESRSQPATYVTLSAISYSLVAPLFHPQSRWISLHNAPAPDSAMPDSRRTEAFLAKAQPGRLMLLVPVVGGMLTQDRLPNAKVSDAMSRQLAPYRLGFAQPQTCRFLPSRSLADIGPGEKTEARRARSGFWLCQLTRLDSVGAPDASRGHRYDAVFKALESQCPRFFPAGGDGASLELAGGEVRSYLQAEMKAYAYDSGEVFYKYYRALNPVLVGRADDLIAGRSRIDCSRIRGRSGLPWEREI